MYGVQTQEASVNSEAYMAMVDSIEAYIVKSPIKYTRLLLQIDSPAQGNKEPNISCFPESFAKILLAVPSKTAGKITRTGGKFYFANDSGWQIGSSDLFAGTITDYPVTPTDIRHSTVSSVWAQYPFTDFPTNDTCVEGQQFFENATMSFSNSFYGANGISTGKNQPSPDMEPSHISSIGKIDDWGFPYQALAPPAEASCQNPQDDGKPYLVAGCPNPISKCAWWVMLTNRLARKMVSAGTTLQASQQITIVSFETESAGAGGVVSCNIFMFMFAMMQFGGTKEDLFPAGQKFIFCYNSGYGGKASDIAKYNECPLWADYKLTDCSGTEYRFGDMVDLMAAPEYYWFKGQDMSGAGPLSGSGFENNEFPFLVDHGFKPCYQSGFKIGRDDQCACRDTIYEKLAHVDHGDERLLDMFDASLFSTLVPKLPSDIENTIPTFSIEHLGPADKWFQFSKCINTQNFTKKYLTEPDAEGNPDKIPGFACAMDSKCQPSCGVANIFGNWTELCFKAFLDKFVASYGYKNVMVYDASFVPESWLPNPIVMTSSDALSSKAFQSCSSYKASSTTCAGQPAVGGNNKIPASPANPAIGFCFCEDTNSCASSTQLPPVYSDRYRFSPATAK